MLLQIRMKFFQVDSQRGKNEDSIWIFQINRPYHLTNRQES